MILIADMNRKDSALEEFISPEERLECIQIAQNLLNQVNSANPQAIIVRMFCRAAGLPDSMGIEQTLGTVSHVSARVTYPCSSIVFN